MNKQGIAIAQINSQAGNFEYNAKKIAAYINKAKTKNAKMILFPEYSLIGNLMKPAMIKFPFLSLEIEKWLYGLANICKDIYAFIGIIDNQNKSATAILHNGKIQKIISEQCPEIVEIYNRKYLVVVGDTKFKQNDFSFDDIIYFKNNIKLNKTFNTNKNGFSYYVNGVGATDFYCCEGRSFVLNQNDEILTEAKFFEEDFLLINPDTNKNGNTFQNYEDKKIFDIKYEDDLERTYLLVKQGIKDYFQKCGLKRAVLGLSGGLDSSVCAVLLSEALGKENVFGISMPSSLTSIQSKSDAELLASNLGINFLNVPIGEITNVLCSESKKILNSAETKWNCRNKTSFVNDNIQARTRATILWNFSNEFEACIPIATSDKSELYMGYATVNGDMSGGIAPISDITKTKLFALADWLNKNLEIKNLIPQSIIDKRPSAELAINPKTGKILLAEEALMPYEFLDEIIWRIEKQKQNYNEILNATFLYEKNTKISQLQKKEWLDKFFKRYSFALYKGFIMPAGIVTDLPTNIKPMYFQPITSANINYVGSDKETIAKTLSEI